MSDRTEPISHISILFRALVFTIVVALMSGRIEAKNAIDFSGLRSLLMGSRSPIAEIDCQEKTCNLSEFLLRGGEKNPVVTEKLPRF